MAPRVVIAVDQGGVGGGVGATVGAGVGVGGGEADGSGDGEGEGDAEADGSGEGDGEADGAGEADGSGDGEGEAGADGLGSTASAPPAAGSTGTAAAASRAATSTPAISRRRERSWSRAGHAGRSMDMLQSLRLPRRTGHGAFGPPGSGLGYQHATPRCTVARMLRIYLGHGASGTAASMAPWVDGLRARGFEAFALDLPRRRAEDAVAAFEAQVPDGPGVVVGGHSYGGRVASLAVAGAGPVKGEPGSVLAEGVAPRRYAGLVCLSYPLHRPGAPETAAARTAHWPAITIPALLLSGTSDPFARIELLEAALPALVNGRLVTYPRLGHTLKPVLDDALDRIATFLAELAPG